MAEVNCRWIAARIPKKQKKFQNSRNYKERFWIQFKDYLFAAEYVNVFAYPDLPHLESRGHHMISQKLPFLFAPIGGGAGDEEGRDGHNGGRANSDFISSKPQEKCWQDDFFWLLNKRATLF